MSRIVAVENYVCKKEQRGSLEVMLQTRLKNLELSMDLDSEDLCIEERVARVEKSFDQRLVDLEKEIYHQGLRGRKK
eukprot:7064345-Ditylum_brightwellii.AAC.1